MSERIDYEQRRQMVFEAASQLQEAGQSVTLESVKSKVGGSYTTLSRALREWKSEREQAKVAVEAPPETVSELAQRFGLELWKTAQVEAGLSVQALKESLTIAGAKVTEELNEVLRSADTMQERISTLEAKLSEAQEARSAAEAKVVQMQGGIEAVQARFDDYKAVSEARVSELTSQLESYKSGRHSNVSAEEVQTLRSEIQSLTTQLSSFTTRFPT